MVGEIVSLRDGLLTVNYVIKEDGGGICYLSHRSLYTRCVEPGIILGYAFEDTVIFIDFAFYRIIPYFSNVSRRPINVKIIVGNADAH